LKNLLITFLIGLVSAASAAAPEDEVIYLGDHFREYWEVKKTQRPVYPQNLLKERAMGCALVGFIIETNGKVSTVEPLSAFPNGAFATAARNAVRKWRFKPTQANTDPFPTYALQNIVFRLEGAGIKKAPPTEEINQICWDAAQRRIAERTGQAPSDLGATD